MKYIAYGSNMSLEQMRYRCPDARFLGTGYLEGWQLEFYLHATVERTGNLKDRVPIALFEISAADKRSLDRYEGCPTYYTEAITTVTMNNGRKVSGLIYLMKMKRQEMPSEQYFGGIAHAYEDLGFPELINTILIPALDRALDSEEDYSRYEREDE